MSVVFVPVFVAFVVLLTSGGGVQAVFTPADSDALKVAVGTCSCTGWNGQMYTSCSCTGGCLGETRDGSCPILAATDATLGNPYGVIGDWDVSAVKDMHWSKCTLSPSLWPCLPLLCILNIRHLRDSSDHNSHTFWYFCFCVF